MATTVGTIQYDAIINTDKLNSGIDEVDGKLQGSGKKALDLANKVAVATTAIVGATVASSIKAFAQYEQLVGGVDKLFGESSDTIQAYAQNAYRTAGLSANQYMETVTGFSASLLKSLGGDTEKAAKIANMAVTDMSDNANVFGTSMESIQYAYQGFAKQNFTMLDNLKLGYGGTKEEMQKLLTDAEKLPSAMGKKFDLTNYADVVQAIHLVQENQKIAGTTAEEASRTISGSFAATKAAWENVLTAFGSGNQQMVKDSMDGLADSASNLVKNIAAIIPNILSGIVDAIVQMGPIAVTIAAIATALTAISAAFAIYTAIQKAAIIVQGLWNAITVAGTAIQWLLNIALSANPIGLLIVAIAAVVAALIWFFTQTELGKDIFKNVVEFITGVWNTLTGVFAAVWEGIKAVWNAAVGFFKGIFDAIMAAIEWYVNIYVQFFKLAWEGIKAIWSVVAGWFKGVWDGIVKVFSVVGSWFGDIFNGAWNAVKSAFSGVTGFFQGVWDSIVGIFGSIGQAVGGAVGGAVNGAINGALSIAQNAVNGFIDMINGALNLINKIPGVSIGKIGRISLPRLAEGGIVDSPTNAIIGEAGKEAVLPLENNTEWMDDLAAKIGGTGNATIVVKIGEETIATKVVELINDRTRLSGNNAILV